MHVISNKRNADLKLAYITRKNVLKYTVHNGQDYAGTHKFSKQNRDKIICAKYLCKLNNAQDVNIGQNYLIFIMSHSLLWRHIDFADGRCLFKQPQSVLYHCNQYDEEISKKCGSVRPSVRL